MFTLTPASSAEIIRMFKAWGWVEEDVACELSFRKRDGLGVETVVWYDARRVTWSGRGDLTTLGEAREIVKALEKELGTC